MASRIFAKYDFNFFILRSEEIKCWIKRARERLK